MEVTNLWLKLACWLVAVAFLIRHASCKLDEKYLRTQPCDVHENTTDRNVVFYCRGRRLREVPKVFSNTTRLDLSENKIKNLTMKDLENLQKLVVLNLNWMNDNHKVNIAPGAFTNLTKLAQLQLNGVGLTHIPKLPKTLKGLSLVGNKIISLNASSFWHLEGLTALYLSRNCYFWNPCYKACEIKNGSFSSLFKLKSLTLSYNNLTYVPRGLPLSLVSLELASNRIAYIGENDFQNLHNLLVLKIQGNCPRCQNAPFPCVPCPNGSIEIHEHAFDHLQKLTLLQLAGNSIRFLKNGWFSNLSKLQELFLSFNFLFDAIKDGQFLTHLPLLSKLDLSFNYGMKAYPRTISLAPTFANLTSLKILHLRALVFKEIDNETLSPLYALQNLSVLDLGTNFLVHTQSDLFSHFQNLKLLYLSENRLYPVSNSKLPQLGSSSGPTFSLPVLSGSSSIREQTFNIPNQLVKPECFNSGRVLDLSRNNIFFISPKQFEGHGNISCLNLSRNGFAAAPNGTEFTALPKLKYLDLSFNKIDLAYDNAFKELKMLEVLDLSFNAHYFTVPGVTHNLNFLKQLPNLRVLNMSSNSIDTLTTKEMHSNSLSELQFQHNNLGKLWRENDKTYDNLFTHLKNLTHLDISYNNLNKIPIRVYDCLPGKLKKFRLSHNGLEGLEWTLLKRFTQLEELILSFNSLVNISQNISQSVPYLRFLDLSKNKISQLTDDFLIGAVNLQWLDLSNNRLAIINQTTFPSKEYSHLSSLWLHGNPFRCTCDILSFILWMDGTNVKIPRLATSVMCNMPQSVKGKPVVNFDIRDCIDDQVAFLIYFFTTFFIICITFTTTVMHLFYWDVSYLFYYMKAKYKGYEYLSSTDNVYDAFVTYDTKDPQVSDWVLNHLRVQLEEQGDRYLPVCLEERDWVPGSPLLESMTQSIQQSRKTVFVLTQSFVNSGSFKMAVYLAHQRLLEESKDVIVLLMLEPVLQSSHFLRLRQRLCSQSVLEWPRAPAAEPWFWQCLRNAIRVENCDMYSKLYSRYFTSRSSSVRD
ncbi:toll-like receptor 8 [Astyanax mexicanus]|uniref:toll-like receptor 8 n=1 Tax=Astyanax mexicanus TaxID=7994 RepID=UPI0020CABA52|nr:toll-like receptor 8 [Astyanax mexicanus]